MSDNFELTIGNEGSPQDSRARVEDAVVAYLSGLTSPGSQATMRRKLQAVAALFKGAPDICSAPWAALHYEHVKAIRNRLVAKGFAPATINLTLAAIRGVAEACVNLGLMIPEVLSRIRSVKSVRGERIPAGREVSQKEQVKLFAACATDPGTAGRRDAALLGLLFGAGIRRAEVAGLRVEDYQPEDGRLLIRGKGNKERLVYVSDGSRAALKAWIKVRGEGKGPLFNPILKSGLILRGKGLSTVSIWKILRSRAGEAQVKERLTPHDARRTLVGNMLDAGIDPVTVAKFVGHASVATTMRYDRRGETAKKRAAEAIRVPYQAPTAE